MYSNPLTKYTLDPQLQIQLNMAVDPEVVYTMDGDGFLVSTGFPVVYDKDGDGYIDWKEFKVAVDEINKSAKKND